MTVSKANSAFIQALKEGYIQLSSLEVLWNPAAWVDSLLFPSELANLLKITDLTQPLENHRVEAIFFIVRSAAAAESIPCINQFIRSDLFQTCVLLQQFGLLPPKYSASLVPTALFPAIFAHERLDLILHTFTLFAELGMLGEKHAKLRCKEILEHASDYTPSVCNLLYQQKWLNSQTLDAVLYCQRSPFFQSSRNPSVPLGPESELVPELSNALERLREAGLLDPSDPSNVITVLKRGDHPMAAASALIILAKAGLLNAANCELIATHPYLSYFAGLLEKAFSLGFFSDKATAQNHFISLIEPKLVHERYLALKGLEQASVLDTYGVALMREKYPCDLAALLITIQPLNLRKDLAYYHSFIKDWSFLKQLENEGEVPAILSLLLPLIQVGLLTGSKAQENFDAILRNLGSGDFAGALKSLSAAALLTQQNFDGLILYWPSLCFINWDFTSDSPLTQSDFTHMLQICEQNKGNIKTTLSSLERYLEDKSEQGAPLRKVRAQTGFGASPSARGLHFYPLEESDLPVATRAPGISIL